MQKTPLHILAELFGISNFVPATPSTAHFKLEISAQSYILDSALTDDAFILCLSRALDRHEENDEEFLQKAAQIANKHKPCLAYNKNNNICFIDRLALDANINDIEKSLENCIACQEDLRR